MAEEVFPWLKSLPLAPEYHPTLDEFQDPVSYIFKIEEEASKYGICKIVPPVSPLPEKAIIANLNRSLSSKTPDSSPTFTTKVQQIGFRRRKNKSPVQKTIWDSEKYYTFPQFEAKAKNFDKKYLKKRSNSEKGLSALEIETLYWKAQFGKPFNVEYASDMMVSAFDQTVGVKEIDDVMTVEESQWNVRGITRAKGNLLKFLKKDLPGINSPMIYMGMLFSWFAWHVEDHDLHSLNYMHMGAAKTWYGIPIDAASGFEHVIKTDGYAGDFTPIVTFATLGGKTTIMPPEVLLKAGVPCCRLVQNAGEFVVTFPRAYHSGFSHGFNCAEAVNIATPKWLRVAREAAIRRASIGFAPIVSHSQLLYDLALSFSSSEDTSDMQSCRLKDRLKDEVDGYVKRNFMEDVMKNNKLLNVMGNGSPITLLSESVLKSLTSPGSLGIQNGEPDTKVDPGSIFSCVSCASPCYASAAIVQLTHAAAQYLEDPESFSGKLPKKSISPTRDQQKDISALGLLASAYNGDSSDSEEENNRASDQIASKLPSNFEYGHPLRMHVFCLQHAHEIARFFESAGGVHMLLLCHPDYPSINSAAKEVAREFGTPEVIWTDLKYVDVNEQDMARIQSALYEEVIDINQDWTVRLGVNIIYTARLSFSPFYRKQMPYNSVTYNAFGYKDPSDDELTTPKQSDRPKKIVVAGRWCGKVWMSNQVHPLLVARDDDQEDETDVLASSKMDLNLERNAWKRKRTPKVELLPVPPLPPTGLRLNAGVKRKPRKRYVNKKTKKAKNGVDKKSRQVVMDSGDEGPTRLRRRITSSPTREPRAVIKSKPKAKKALVTEVSEVEEEFECNIEGCGMAFEREKELENHKQNKYCVVGGSDRDLMQDQRVDLDDLPLTCPRNDCRMTFKRRVDGDGHVWVHIGDQPSYVCTKDGCGQSFMFVSNFILHKRITKH